MPQLSQRNTTVCADLPSRLVYVMGPSGAGKDALLAYARTKVDPARIIFAHRYITRPADVAENHVVLSPQEFGAREKAGLFALAWESHGFHYAIGAAIDLWRAQHFVVVVSGARAAWSRAVERYPDAIGILIDAPPEIRAQRLAARGREDAAAISERLAREIPVPIGDGRVHCLDNNGALAVAGEEFVARLQGCCAPLNAVV